MYTKAGRLDLKLEILTLEFRIYPLPYLVSKSAVVDSRS